MNFSEQLKIIQKEKKLKYVRDIYGKSTSDGFLECVKILQKVARKWLIKMDKYKNSYAGSNSIIQEQNIEYTITSSKDYIKDNKDDLTYFLYSYYYLVIWCKPDSIFDVINYFYDNCTYTIATKYYDDEILLKKISRRNLRVLVFYLRYEKYNLPSWINIPSTFRKKFINDCITKLQI